MNLIGGMDEAGLGPLLGPLTIGGVLLELPHAAADAWTLLAGAVTSTTRRGRRKGEDPLLVADSKRVFTGPRRWVKLERTALAFMNLAWGSPPADAAALAARLHFGGSPPERRGAPWLERLDLALPCWISPGQVELDAHLLHRRAAAAGLGLRRLVLGALHPARFNAHIGETGSKSVTHFHWLMEGLLPLLQEGAELVVLDRTGALTDHARLLARAFPGVGVTRTRKEKKEQRYLLRRGERRIALHFREKGEDSSFAVALAACLAKYVREVFMECQNRWFTSRQPGLKPTRGYYLDGRRFLGEAREVIQAESLPEQVFIRCR